jgi:hypothetical protein
MDFGVEWCLGPLYEEIRMKQQQSSWMPSLFSRRNVALESTRSVLKVCILGGNSVGKSAFVWHVSGLRAPGIEDVEIGANNTKFQDTVVIGGFYRSNDQGNNSKRLRMENNSSSDGILADSCFAVVHAVPLHKEKDWLDTNILSCDVVVLMYQCGDEESLETAIRIEKTLPTRVPRLFFASKYDTVVTKVALDSQRGGRNQSHAETENNAQLQRHVDVYRQASKYVQERQLPAIQQLSVVTGEGVSAACSMLFEVAAEPERALPVTEKKVLANQRFSRGLFTGLTIALGVVSVSLIVRYNKEIRERVDGIFISLSKSVIFRWW